jgi:hypothetical protein
LQIPLALLKFKGKFPNFLKFQKMKKKKKEKKFIVIDVGYWFEF